ncbi:MAG TPA: 16S rRNA (guanine(966)-N(2))-methyltransferase RsmD [Acidobacteriaceae bacterium]|nr:16S rRNA (guanine(966)-N(2))-methyltransferase RsmD [Acidobacteriaceae bacterium]
MRVIAGKYRSQPLAAPKGRDTRPTSDRLRETLFNIIAPYVQDAIFTDLFAGTGAVGIEAISRGARQVYFAENAKIPLQTLHHNLERLGIRNTAIVEPAGTMPLLRRLLHQKVALDLIFLDPPYKDQLAYETVLRFLAEHSILHEDAIVVVEHSRRYSLPNLNIQLQPYRTIEQGEAALTFFHCNTKPASHPSADGD